MGACMSNKQQLRTALQSPAQFSTDYQNPNKTIRPLYSTLYNLLRKPSQIQIIRNNANTNKLFNREIYPNLSVLQPKEVKTLFSFKQVLLIGPCGSILDSIRSMANPKHIYQITQSQAVQFIKKYPIFAAGSPQYSAKQLPICAIDSQQILKPGPRKQLFLHSSSLSSSSQYTSINKIYNQLQIKQSITDTPTNTNPQSKQTARAIHKTNAPCIVLLHSKQRKHQDLLQILTDYLVMEYRVTELNAKVYLRRILPQASLLGVASSSMDIPANNDSNDSNNNNNNSMTLLPSPAMPAKSASLKLLPRQSLSLTQVFQRHLYELYQQMGSNSTAVTKLSNSHNLLSTLLSNIYNNKNTQSYRKVRKNNSQIYDILGKYKAGIKLLNQIGFIDSAGNYVNNTDVKYLKIYRTDLDMAYRNVVLQIQDNTNNNNNK